MVQGKAEQDNDKQSQQEIDKPDEAIIFYLAKKLCR